MIERVLTITGSDADLLSRALSEVKTKAYEEYEVQLGDNKRSMRSYRISVLLRAMDTKKRDIMRILTP